MIKTLTNNDNFVKLIKKNPDWKLQYAEVVGVGSVYILDTFTLNRRVFNQLTKLGMISVGESCYRPVGDGVCFHPEVPDRSKLGINQYFYKRNDLNVSHFSYLVQVDGNNLKSSIWAVKIDPSVELLLRMEGITVIDHSRYAHAGYKLPLQFDTSFTFGFFNFGDGPIIANEMYGRKLLLSCPRINDQEFINYIETHIQIASKAAVAKAA